MHFNLFLSYQSKNLSIDARIELCRIAFYCLRIINENSVDFQRKKVKDGYIVRYVDGNTFNRLSNNFLCYAHAFKYYGQNIQTSSLGTHPLELTFGRIRQGSFGNDTSEMAINIVAKGKMRDRLLSNLGKDQSTVKGRCNIAGSCQSEEWNLDIPNHIDYHAIPIEILQICDNEMQFEDFLNSNIWNLVVFLNENSPTYVPSLSGANSGSRIISRLHNY